MSVSFSLLARARTPADVVAKVNDDVKGIVRDEAFRRQFLEVHVLQPLTGSAADLGRFLDVKSDKWAKLILDTNLTID